MLPTIEHRVGLLIPSSNSLIEPEYYAVMPRSVSVHFGRLTMTEVTEAGIARQDEDIVRQAQLLATAKVSVILFCQTAASFYMGLEYDQELQRRIEEESGIPALTAAQTIVAALNSLGVHRVALATPFVPEINQISSGFLAKNGFEVVAMEGLSYVDNFSIAQIEPQTVRDLIRRADRPEAEAIIVPGGNMPCMFIAGEMEKELGKFIITTNQAGIWALLRRLGGFERLPGLGRLLEAHLG